MLPPLRRCPPCQPRPAAAARRVPRRPGCAPHHRTAVRASRTSPSCCRLHLVWHRNRRGHPAGTVLAHVRMHAKLCWYSLDHLQGRKLPKKAAMTWGRAASPQAIWPAPQRACRRWWRRETAGAIPATLRCCCTSPPCALGSLPRPSPSPQNRPSLVPGPDSRACCQNA